jgi:HSP20 family protein
MNLRYAYRLAVSICTSAYLHIFKFIKYPSPSSVFHCVNNIVSHLKQTKMYCHQTSAAKGEHGSRNRHLLYRSMQRAAVNVHKTDSSYEMLVFAPGRIKEHFSLAVNGQQLTVSYTPPQDFPKHDWVMREYSRGGFVRSFALDETVDTAAISAKYADGVLQVSLPLKAGATTEAQHIAVQ